ncbi:BON domain-containing protein [Pelagicoccus mobilis]|uniref:BON domain-containing protein n=1 Tax=Pelagicoccus mobilis TaxID=415221 RepID=A0A934RXU7_9BACT|nr:BON domain-containing protein [Pelagicoccus mobilis]MBK1878323.1 BON domain-containing protein [Pelagicoccus mobilis]
MKTFFVALILGIFVGLFINNYFSDPEAYTKIKDAKERLFSEEEAEPLQVAEPELASDEPEPAMFEVASKELNAGSKTAAEEPTPEPLPKPEPLQPQEPEAEAKETQETPAEEPQDLVEQGVEKAAEIAEEVKEKINEAAENAKPHIEQGIESGIDATIALAIMGQFKLEKRIASDALSVSVEEQVVTLTGSVPDEETKQLAIEIAVFTKGVVGVEEELEIKP